MDEHVRRGERGTCNISSKARSIYHLLCRSFGQRISIPEIVDFDVFDIVAIGHVYVAVNLANTGTARGLWSSCIRCSSFWSGRGLNGWHINMLYTTPSFYLSIDLRGCGSCGRGRIHWCPWLRFCRWTAYRLRKRTTTAPVRVCIPGDRRTRPAIKPGGFSRLWLRLIEP